MFKFHEAPLYVVYVVQGKIKSDDAFDTDMGIHRERLDQIANLAQDMVQQGFSKVTKN